MKKFMKRALGVIACMALSIVITGLSNNECAVYADENTNFIVEALDINTYKDVAPKPTTEGYKDWIFAGWYNEESCKTYISNKDGVTGNKYAKFVPADVLSVKCQNEAGATATTEKTKMRLVTTVDTLNYREVGFEIKIGEQSKDIKINTVYSQISATVDAMKFEHQPNIFSDASQYFATVTLTNIPKDGFAQGIFIKPYWITVDGTKVYGVGRYARIEDSWENIVNVPVRLYTDKDVAACSLNLHYDKANYTYVGTNGFDVGNVLDEIYISDNAQGKITCVGNTSTMTNNVKADGILVNLRFKKIGEATSSVFTVDNEQFANKDENFVYTSGTSFDVSDIQYKTVTNK